MKKLIALLVVVTLLLGGWYIASPWLAMRGIADAARDGDEAALEERIDFAQLREGTSRSLAETIEERTRDGGLLGRIGGAIAGEVADSAVDNVLTPRGVAEIVNSGSFAAPLVPERLRGQELEWQVERHGLNSFAGVSTWDDGTAGPVLRFERDGLGWDLIGVELAEWR